MENFIVSARKYRPQTFDTVVGQLHIASTLKNAIKSNHLAQAYLFCGPRGVGKTTCARILAKTINCSNCTKNIEACDECESCKSFNAGHSLNIYELDAASNNSVEDIRNLINQVSFAPQLGSHKVYIIDEVHMLSQAAFNAFLKTLEEPPKHAIFILATTEKHKIIPTILSRCQIFDFNRIKIEDAATHLAEIAKKEKVKAEAEALHIIAQKADGAMRDALSIFDQMVAVAGNTITYKTVIDNLNILDYDYYFKITDSILEKNTSATLLTFNEIISNGFEGHLFLNGLAEHVRNLLVCKDEATLQLMEVSAGVRERYKTQSKKTDTPFLISALSRLNKADVQYKASRNQRLLVELTLLQLCSLQTAEAEKKNDFIVAPAGKVPQKEKAQPVIEKVTVEVKEPVAAYSTPKVATETILNVNAVAPLKQPVAKTEPVKKINESLSIKKGMLSISQLTGSVASEKNNVAIKNSVGPIHEKKDTDQEPDLMSIWNSFALFLKQKNKINLYSTLTAHQPVQTDDKTISFTVLNEVQADDINTIKTDLLIFLRKELRKPMLQVIIEVNKTEAERKPYTGEEKYKRLAEKNPTLNKLRQHFGLEIDY